MEKTANSNPMKGMLLLFVALGIAIVVGALWNQVPAIKQTIHAIGDPTLGALLDYNKMAGMLIIVALFSLLTVLIQKYGTDQETLKEIKKEQKILQEEMKKYRDQPDKLMELNKKQLEFIPKTMEITARPMIYTVIPFVLFFRWFTDYFVANPYKFFGFFTWFWFYLLTTIIFSSIFRKVLKVA